jgi:trans-aconitate methyltransferase
MDPFQTGSKYDKIATWWQRHHTASSYGVSQLQRTLRFAPKGGLALDVGCGAGGRLIEVLTQANFAVTGVDVSEEMIQLARAAHPDHEFIHADISRWQSAQTFDVIVAWDSLFHLPYARQETVIAKLCTLLSPQGVLMYTFGNGQGEHTDQWHNDTFYYSSLGINKNLALLASNGLSIMHLELDQYPEKHVYTIASKAHQA